MKVAAIDFCFLEMALLPKIDELSLMKLLLEVQINNQTCSFPIPADCQSSDSEESLQGKFIYADFLASAC